MTKTCKTCAEFRPVISDDEIVDKDLYGLCGKAIHIMDYDIRKESVMVVCDSSQYGAVLYVSQNHFCKSWSKI
jgi:hypothetical protein